jgi:hypothetical protein
VSTFFVLLSFVDLLPSTKLTLGEPGGILTEEVGLEVECILTNMFLTTKSVGREDKRDPPTKERRALKTLIQICQKPFFNPRIAKFTGSLI